jgi:pilus assembly protein Flp/PilA
MFAYAFALLQSVKVDSRGVTALEYGLLAGLIAVVIIGAVQTLGTDLNTLFTNIGTKISAV